LLIALPKTGKRNFYPERFPHQADACRYTHLASFLQPCSHARRRAGAGTVCQLASTMDAATPPAQSNVPR